MGGFTGAATAVAVYLAFAAASSHAGLLLGVASRGVVP